MPSQFANLHVFIVGNSYGSFWSLPMSYVRAFQNIGCKVTFFDEHSIFRKYFNLPWRYLTHFTRLPITFEYNRALLRSLSSVASPVDLFFMNKCLDVWPRTLKFIKQRFQAPLFHFHNDDYFHPQMSSRLAAMCVPFYDCIFTPAKFNLPELLRAGAKRVEYLPFGYDPSLHNCIRLSKEEIEQYKADVVFVGTWRKEREEMLNALPSSQRNCSLKVWGPGPAWQKLPSSSSLRKHVSFTPVFGEDLAKVVAGAKINLAFVTRFGEGRVIHVMRTFEIPAMGGFMLAERAGGEFLEFFDENREIACFGDSNELKEKIDYYLAHDDEREAIAKAGRERLLRSGYSYDDRARSILAVYRKLQCTNA